MTKYVMVTGSEGFIGKHLCWHLKEKGYEVTPVDLTLGHDIVMEVPNFKPGSIDEIYHLASFASPRAYMRDPLRTIQVNVEGTRKVLEAAVISKVKRVLLASTSEVYGHVPHEITEDFTGTVSTMNPRSCYAESKRCAEALAVAARAAGMDVRIARIFNSYGPGFDLDDGRMVPEFIKCALLGEPIPVYGTGLQTRSFCYVSDTVRGLVALMEHDPMLSPRMTITPKVVNIGNPDERRVRDVAELILGITGVKGKICQVQLPEGEPLRRLPDVNRARRALGWWPEVPLLDGLTRTIQDIRDRI